MSYMVNGTGNGKATLSIPCPKCGYTTVELITNLQKNKFFACAGCGKKIVITGNGLAALEAIKKSFLGFN